MAKKALPNFTAEPGPALHTARWRFGPFTLDEGKRELCRDGVTIEIEPKPLNMLMLMLRHPGELVTKNDLMEALWTGRIVTESVLSNCAAKLRVALGEGNGNSESATDTGVRVRTVHGYGYRLEAAPELLTSPASEPEPPQFAAGTMVPFRPNWRLLRRLGMSGETWLAEQPGTREQRVFKFALTPRALSALKREVTLYRLLRQTLEARAPVVDLLDWNFDEPPWFIETDYCELGSLTDYLDSQGGAAALSMAARLGLIIQLAEALSAVHSVGILHKDLKPANVLVRPPAPGSGSEVQLKLCDFGAGRLLDYGRLDALAITRLGFTHFAESVGGSSNTSGTPLYYAPEVLSGQPATLKADIYALGVMLYQLVVGDMRRLFAPGWEAGIEDELIREDIAACAAGDTAIRIGDALALAQRLRSLSSRREQRRRAQEAQAAAAATAVALQRSEARRSGLLAAAVALAAGLALSVVMFLRAEQAERRAVTAADRAVAVKDFILRDVLGVLASGDQPVQGLTVSALLGRAAEQATARFRRQPDLEALVRLQLGLGFEQLELRELAGAQLEIAVRQGGFLVHSDPKLYGEIVGALILNQINLGAFASRRGEFEGLLRSAAQVLGPAHPALLEPMRGLAIGDEQGGQPQRAKTMTTRALAVAVAMAPSDPRLLFNLRKTRGRSEIILSEFANAESDFAEALRLGLPVFGPDHSQIGDLYMRQGYLAAVRGRYAAAAGHFGAAAAIARRWEPVSASLSQSIVSYRAFAALEQGDTDAAARELANLDRMAAAGPKELARASFYTHYLRARLALARRQPGLAYEEAGLALDGDGPLGRSRIGSHVPQLVQLQAESLLKQGRTDAARALLDGPAMLALRGFPNTSLVWAEQARLQGLLRLAMDPPDTARPLLQDAKRRFTAALGDAHPRSRELADLLAGLRVPSGSSPISAVPQRRA